jgi:hypothetical protein
MRQKHPAASKTEASVYPELSRRLLRPGIRRVDQTCIATPSIWE